MDQLILWILGICALIGGLDRAFGNRLGLGKRFEDGFMLLGPTALSMAGIICLVPLISDGLKALIDTPGMPFSEPSILSGLLAIDMGGYQLACELASDQAFAAFSGIIVAATLGCTITFTIPIGMGMLDDASRADFARGILFGLIALPASLMIGGVLCGLSIIQIIRCSMPVLLISMLVLMGIWKKTALTLRIFSAFARFISILTTLGLTLAAFDSITGFSIVPGLGPLQDAMEVVASIAIVMLGSLPAAELLQRALKKPLEAFGKSAGINRASAAGLLIGMVSVLPAIALVKDMDQRGRIINAAFMVCAASAFAAHLGFTAGVNAAMIPAMLASKLAGGIAGALIALWATRRRS